MTLTFAHIILSAGIEPKETLVIRHAYVREHEDGSPGIHADSRKQRSWPTPVNSRRTPVSSPPLLRGSGSSFFLREETVPDCGQC